MKTFLQKLLVVLIFIAGSGNVILYAQDFVHNEGPLNETSSWTPEPGDFTTDNQSFIINGEAFVDSDWTLAGNGTELVIDTDEEITFQSGTIVTFDGITIEFTDEGRADLILDGDIEIIGGVNWEGDPGDFWSVEIENDGDQTISVDQSSKLMAYNFDSEKTSGTLDLISVDSPSIVFEAFNNLDLDFSGTALFRDNGNSFVVGDDIEMDGDAAAYALTGTLEHRVMDGNSDYETVVPELNNLYLWVREDGNPRFRDEEDYTQEIKINGDFTVDMISTGDFEFNDVILDIGGTFDLTHHRPEAGHDNGDGEGEIDVDDALITIGGDFIARFSKDLPDGDENIDVDDAEITVNGNLYIFVFEDGEFDFDDSQFNVMGYADFDIRDGGIVDMDETNFSVENNLTILIDETGELDTGDLEDGAVFVGGDLIIDLLDHNNISLVDTDKFDVTGDIIINAEELTYSFTVNDRTFTEDFNSYRGTSESLPAFFSVTWDEERISNPWGGVGDFNTSDPDTEYGNLAAYTSDNEEFSFGIRERAPDDLRDARLFFAFTNDTDEPISQFEVSYEVEAWYIGDRRNRLRLKFDTMLDSDDRDTFETDIFSTDNPSATETPGTKVDGSLDENRVLVTDVVDITTIDDGTGSAFAPLEPGETAYFRWQFSNTEGDGGSLRSGLAINNLSISLVTEEVTHSFTDDDRTFIEDFNDYRGSAETLPEFFSVTWDTDRISDPWGGVGDFDTSDPDTEYGNFAAYTSDNSEFSFGIRERAPDDLRDARLFFSFTNNTSEPLTTFEVSYDVEAWYIGDRRNRIRLKFDTMLDSDDRDTFETDIFSTDNPSATETPGTKVDGSLDENRVLVTDVVDITTIDDGTGSAFAPLEPGETAYFRWQFSNTSGDGGSLRSGLAVNNLSITAVDDNGTSIEGTEVAREFGLKQNYPNPFNPTTVIPYTVDQTGHVSLEIFNMLGQRVATVVNENVQAGSHTVSFDASGLTSGMYIYRLTVGNQVDYRSMTLIK